MDFYWESCKMNKPISFVSHWIWHDLLRLQQKTNINIYVYDIYWFFFQYFPSENHCYADVARCYLSLSTYPAEAILHNLRASPQFRSVSQALFPRLSGKHTPSLQEPGVWLEKVWVPGGLFPRHQSIPTIRTTTPRITKPWPLCPREVPRCQLMRRPYT